VDVVVEVLEEDVVDYFDLAVTGFLTESTVCLENDVVVFHRLPIV